MLIQRAALEVSRLCLPPGDDVSAVATHVFIDDARRVAATDGACLLRADGTPKQDPDLFMADVEGADEVEAVTIPSDIVSDFLRAWGGDQVVVHRNGSGVSLASADGQASRLFEVKDGTLDAPHFDRMLKVTPVIEVRLSVKVLGKVLSALKAMGATSLRLGLTDAVSLIRIDAEATDGDGKRAAIEGALMPMRD